MYNWTIKRTVIFNIWIIKKYSDLNYLVINIPTEIIIYINQLLLKLFDIHESNRIPCYEKDCMNHWLDLFNSFDEDELKKPIGFYHCKLKNNLTDMNCHNIRYINDNTYFCGICGNPNCKMHQYGIYFQNDDGVICCDNCSTSLNLDVDPYF